MRRILLLIFDFFAFAHPLTRCLLPPPPSFSLDKEVAGNEEGIDDDDINDAAKDIDAAANDDVPTDNDNDYVTMPPKVKPIPMNPHGPLLRQRSLRLRQHSILRQRNDAEGASTRCEWPRTASWSRSLCDLISFLQQEDAPQECLSVAWDDTALDLA